MGHLFKMTETLGAFGRVPVITVGPSKVGLFDKLELGKTFLVLQLLPLQNRNALLLSLRPHSREYPAAQVSA